MIELKDCGSSTSQQTTNHNGTPKTEEENKDIVREKKTNQATLWKKERKKEN